MFASFDVSSKSSHRVLGQSCRDDVAAALVWIGTATVAKIEGTYPPFCYPDDYFGHDVLFLFWNYRHTEFAVVFPVHGTERMSPATSIERAAVGMAVLRQ